MPRESKTTAVEEPLAGPAHRPGRFLGYCLSLMLTGLVALAWLSMLTYEPTDWPSAAIRPAPAAHNAAGHFGAFVAYYLLYYIGAGAYMAVLAASVISFVLLCGGHIRHMGWRVLGVVLLTASTSAAVQLMHPGVMDVAHVQARGPGLLGFGIGLIVQAHMGPAGSWLVVLVAFAIGMMFSADDLVLKLPHFSRKLWASRSVVPAAVQAVKSRWPKPQPVTPTALTANPRGGAVVLPGGGKTAAPKADPAEETPRRPLLPKIRRPVSEEVSEPAPKGVPKAEKVEKPDKAAKGDKGTAEEGATPEKYVMPSADLLLDPSGGYQESQEAVAARKREVLQQTIDDFGVQAQVVGYMTGPVITLFELSLSPGVKVSQVASLAKDIARALAVPAVRIVSPLPNKDTIGIEVPNPDKEIVRIKELMALAPEAEAKMQLPLYLGKDAAGDAIVSDLAGMPHMLIAGTTGSGKSVCINTIIMSLLMTRTPEQVGFILADPKMVEMAAYENIPHLLCPIVTDMRRAEDILEWAATKMDERYEVLKEAGVRNIASYNKLEARQIYEIFGAETDEEKARVPVRMPHYVIIIDELADLMMTSGKDVEGYIIRIAQKARAVGIHLVLATQRPSVNVVTGLIKSNMPCRVSFRVASRQESRIVLDQNGADVLLGQGDMLFLPPGVSTLIRAQGTYVSDSEIHSVVDQLKKSCGEPKYNNELVRVSSASMSEESGERDEMFDEAVEIVLQSQRGSVSLLQRRLQIGYTRAARIIDQMADAGILGDYKNAQARECCMTLEQWQQVKASIAADQSGASAANGEPTSS